MYHMGWGRREFEKVSVCVSTGTHMFFWNRKGLERNPRKKVRLKCILKTYQTRERM